MTDGQLLFLIMALIYAGECLVWLPNGAYACIRFLGSKRRLRPAPSNFSSVKGGWIFAPPLPPLGTTFVVRHSPVCVTETGLAAFMIESPNPGFRPGSVIGASLLWDDVGRITRDGKKIYINGEFFVGESTPEAAQSLLSFLIEIWKAETGERKRKISRRMQRSFSVRRISRILGFWERKSLSLRLFCNLLLFLLFGGLPATIILFGASLELLACAMAALLTMFIIAFRFFFLYRRLYPEVGYERWQWFFLILLVPQQSVRAHDLLLKGALAGFHPLAVGDLALRKESAERQEFMGKEIRDLLFPLSWNSLGEGKAGTMAEGFYRGSLRPEVEKFAEAHGDELQNWKVPGREEDAENYCPRCFETFSDVRIDQCQDCGGIETRAWEN